MSDRTSCRVRVFPGHNAFRYSYFVQGLRNVYSPRRLHCTLEGFEPFDHHCLPIILGDSSRLKIYISAGDGPGYNQAGLRWCDVYAKRTLLAEEVPEEFRDRIIPMGPHFGIRVWGLAGSLWHALKTLAVGRSVIRKPADHVWYYLKQYRYRVPEGWFQPGESRGDYAFYAATLYPTHPGYNRSRALFIRACRSLPDLEFEGGLIRADDYRDEQYDDVTVTRYYRMPEWLGKVRESALGFWAPGDQGAMTLKLGEFLACGKAIICVPMRQEMLPAPLVHGEHVHFVEDDYESIREAVILLCQDRDYRRKLEVNARRYYEEHVRPDRAIRRFVREACERRGCAEPS